MRYQELVETIDDDVIRKIHNNCMPFLKEAEGKFLYRGLDIVEREDKPIMVVSPEEDRYPMNTPQELQNIVNDWFRKYGFKAHRGNSFFCTSSFSDAEKYGVPHAIFPIGNYSYTWSPLIHDFFEDIDRTRITKDKSKNFNNLANNASANFYFPSVYFIFM